MAVLIKNVEADSIAFELEIKGGDTLVSINDKEIIDYFDYKFYMESTYLEVVIKDQNDELTLFEIEKDEDEDLGLEFETYLIDSHKTCKNKCIFCFIDQMPKGLRDTLYVKDDDARMSFLLGNYITLTNLGQRDLDRIVDMKISPINVSVHTTDPELRLEMMKNPKAKDIMKNLEYLSKGGITLNCQIVLCRGVNDGENLKRTILDLKSLNVKSVSIVPVGISKFRDNLYPLSPFRQDDCRKIIDMVEEIASDTLKEKGRKIFFLSDEFYITAKRSLPPYKYYEDFPQIENGVGLVSTFEKEIYDTLNSLESDSEIHRTVSLVTGEIMGDFIKKYAKDIKNKFPNVNINVYPIKNNFFGGYITVTGLVVGEDILSQLKDKPLGDTLLIPASMLRFEKDLFLDDTSILDIEKNLNIKTQIVENYGEDFVLKIIGKE